MQQYTYYSSFVCFTLLNFSEVRGLNYELLYTSYSRQRHIEPPTSPQGVAILESKPKRSLKGNKSCQIKNTKGRPDMREECFVSLIIDS